MATGGFPTPRPVFAWADFPVRVGPVAFLGLALISEVAGALGLFSVPVLDVLIARRFHLSLVGMGGAVAAIDLGMTVGLAIAGHLSDRIGPRALLGAGAVAIAGCAVGLGSIRTLGLFLAALALYGVALTAVPAAGMKAVFHAFAGRARGLPMGIRQTGTPIGAGLAALLLPSWAASAGLAVIFRLIALLLLTTGVAFAALIRRAFAMQRYAATAPAPPDQHPQSKSWGPVPTP